MTEADEASAARDADAMRVDRSFPGDIEKRFYIRGSRWLSAHLCRLQGQDLDLPGQRRKGLAFTPHHNLFNVQKARWIAPT